MDPGDNFQIGITQLIGGSIALLTIVGCILFILYFVRFKR